MSPHSSRALRAMCITSWLGLVIRQSPHPVSTQSLSKGELDRRRFAVDSRLGGSSARLRHSGAKSLGVVMARPPIALGGSTTACSMDRRFPYVGGHFEQAQSCPITPVFRSNNGNKQHATFRRRQRMPAALLRQSQRSRDVAWRRMHDAVNQCLHRGARYRFDVHAGAFCIIKKRRVAHRSVERLSQDAYAIRRHRGEPRAAG